MGTLDGTLLSASSHGLEIAKDNDGNERRIIGGKTTPRLKHPDSNQGALELSDCGA